LPRMIAVGLLISWANTGSQRADRRQLFSLRQLLLGAHQLPALLLQQGCALFDPVLQHAIKLRELLLPLGQGRSHAVEGFSQVADLIAGVHRQMHLPLTPGHPPGGCLQFADGAGEPLRDGAGDQVAETAAKQQQAEQQQARAAHQEDVGPFQQPDVEGADRRPACIDDRLIRA